MSVQKLTFDGALNTAKTDALFNYFLTDCQNGIIEGVGNECTASSVESKVIFKNGFVSIYGRKIYIEEGTSIDVILDSDKKGYVIIKVDTSTNNVELKLKEGSNSAYPELTQNDLIADDGIFELPICSYSKTASSLTLGKEKVTYVNLITSKINTAKTDLITKIDAIQDGVLGRSYSGSKAYNKNRYSFNIDDVYYKSGATLSFQLCNHIFTMPLALVKQKSGKDISYDYLGTTYQMNIEADNGTLTIELPGDQKIKNVYITY